MEDNYYLPNYNDDDVLSFGDTMFKLGKFRDAVKFAFTEPNRVPDALLWALREKRIETLNTKKLLDDGLDSEVLRLGAKGWQKGKVMIRVSLEFCPEEPEISQPESPLDDIRQMMKEDSQQHTS